MNKYVNILLIGFIVFIVGIVFLNFELYHFDYVDYLPDSFLTMTDKYKLNIDKNKKYKINRKKYNQNIVIKKHLDNSLGEEIIIQVKHSETSDPIININSSTSQNEITLSNELNLDSFDKKKILYLIKDSLKNKKIYNYNLLKYSVISVYGNEDILSNIEID